MHKRKRSARTSVFPSRHIRSNGVLIFRAGVRVSAVNSWERMRYVIFCFCSCLYLNMRVPSVVNQRL